MIHFRYVESKNLAELTQEQFTNVCYHKNEFSMFLLLRHILKSHKSDLEVNWKVFLELKVIISGLAYFKPEGRMKLENAGKKLEELKKYGLNKFTLLDPILQTVMHDDLSETTPTNKTYALGDLIGSSQLFTLSTAEDELHLTQRNTRLCVSFAAMKLLCFALIEFLEQPCNFNENKQALEDSVDKVSKDDFMQQLLSICCNVISPRPLNGLNYGHFDDYFNISSQAQNISKSIQNISLIYNLIDVIYFCFNYC